MNEIDSSRRTIALADGTEGADDFPFAALRVSAKGQVPAADRNSLSLDRGPNHAEANLAREAQHHAFQTL